MMNPMEGMKGKLREQREWVKIRKTFSGLVKAAFPGILLTRGPGLRYESLTHCEKI
jgi:hypothetical protein